jgi:hypothetical protein
MATVGGRVSSVRHTRLMSYVKVEHDLGEESIVIKPAVMGQEQFDDWKKNVAVGDLVQVKGDKLLKFVNSIKILTLSAHDWRTLQAAPKKASPSKPSRSTVLRVLKKEGNIMQLTVQDAIKTFGVDIDPHLEREFEIPVLNELQRQGDVIVIPTPKKNLPAKAAAVGAAGVPVVRGENGGNTHLLLAQGDVKFAPIDSTTEGQLDVGVFTVADGATAFLAHPEHGYMGIAPGTYTVRRQREQADEIRQVAD